MKLNGQGRRPVPPTTGGGMLHVLDLPVPASRPGARRRTLAHGSRANQVSRVRGEEPWTSWIPSRSSGGARPAIRSRFGAGPAPGWSSVEVNRVHPHREGMDSTAGGECDLTVVWKSCIWGLTHIVIMESQSRAHVASGCDEPSRCLVHPAGKVAAVPRRGSGPASPGRP